MIVGEGRITVASRDPEALNQFENLLKTLQRGRRVRIETGNYSMFLLQNADAKQLAEVIKSCFGAGHAGEEGILLIVPRFDARRADGRGG